MPRLAWVAMIVAVRAGVLALALAVVGALSDSLLQVGPEVTAPNPLNLGARIPPWVYRLGVVCVIAGGVVYLVRIARALRGARDPQGERTFS